MKILVTGAAGFIGFHITEQLLLRGDEVIGIDNINSYYPQSLKYGRLNELGILENQINGSIPALSSIYPRFKFLKSTLNDREGLHTLFEQEKFDAVINLAAQAGVRYSIENPYAYAESNLTGFLNLLECCRHYPVKHFVFASSSSVYGMNNNIPFSEEDQVDNPVSLYAATKKSNELMAHAYSNLYDIPTTGLRFFTVYGPWGRPDMAPMLFTRAILGEESIKEFNNGNLSRDFTYIDDIVDGVLKVLDHAPEPNENKVRYTIYNIGCGHPVRLMDFITILEHALGKKARLTMLPMQPGDVYQTYADTSKLESAFGYKPTTMLQEGIQQFAAWYLSDKNPLR